MPELTEEEIKNLGSHTLSYYDKNAGGYVQEKASLHKFLTLVGVTGDAEDMLIDLVYQSGEMELHTTTYGVVKIKLLGA